MPTHIPRGDGHHSKPDLVLASPGCFWAGLCTIQDTLGSNYATILFEVLIPSQVLPQYPQKSKANWCLAKADWTSFHDEANKLFSNMAPMQEGKVTSQAELTQATI